MMKTHAVRMYGKNDIRLEKFDLPPIQDDEILARVISDSACKSTYKAVLQGSSHRHVRDDLADHPVIIGHEFCGEMIKIGKKWQHKFHVGDKFSVQPKIEYEGFPEKLRAPGYSYEYFGGATTYAILPNEFIEKDCVLEYSGDAFFLGSLAEPISCIIRAFHANYHCEYGTYIHHMGIAEDGNLALLAGCGPMGLGAIDYAIHGERTPRVLVMTCTNEARLKRAESIYTTQHAAEHGVTVHYVNPKHLPHPEEYLRELTNGQGYDDVFVFVPSKALVEQADNILGMDGCLNCFAGPPDPNFSAECNFYNIHYRSHHIIGTFGGMTDDMREALRLMSEGVINPAAMITHIGGLNSVVETTLNLPKIPGGKKLMYTNIDLELTAIEDFEEKGTSDPLFAVLDEITADHKNLWSPEAEKYLLAHAKKI
jgi:threonine dehydrogenase-like Zn-dependent dehydrogenase